MSKITISREDADRAFPKIEKRLGLYLYLINIIDKVDVSQEEDFQSVYNDYFSLNFAKKTVEFKDTYYRYMQECKGIKLGFGTILSHLYTKAGSMEPSFSSKLLSIIDQDMPVWDSKVREKLKEFGTIQKVPPHYRRKNGEKYPNIDGWNEFYTQKICGYINEYLSSTEESKRRIKQFNEWYKGFLGRNEAKKWINQFSEHPLCLKHDFKTDISDVKIIDLLLWKAGEK